MIKKCQIISLSNEHLSSIHNLLIEQFGGEAWSKEQLISSYNTGNTKYFGIVEDGELVCFASILVSVDDINLLDIATKQEHKRKGYAKAMLSYLISIKNKDQTFSLEVKETNLSAIKLYESFGFKTLNIRKNYYRDGTNALCMFLLK